MEAEAIRIQRGQSKGDDSGRRVYTDSEEPNGSKNGDNREGVCRGCANNAEPNRVKEGDNRARMQEGHRDNDGPNGGRMTTIEMSAAESIRITKDQGG